MDNPSETGAKRPLRGALSSHHLEGAGGPHQGVAAGHGSACALELQQFAGFVLMRLQLT